MDLLYVDEPPSDMGSAKVKPSSGESVREDDLVIRKNFGGYSNQKHGGRSLLESCHSKETGTYPIRWKK